MSSELISALGAGSGVDVKALAEGLVSVEREPRKKIIDDKIAKSEAKISGYAVVMAALANVKTTLEGLNDRSDFNAVNVTNSDESSFSVTADVDSVVGQSSVKVIGLARGQTSSSASFTSADQQLNGGDAFSLQLSVGGGEHKTVRVAGGSGQQQIIAFTGATESGVMRVAGIDVSVVAGDSATVISQKVAAALGADDFFGLNSGRAVVDNGDGSVTLTFSDSDGAVSEVDLAGQEALGVEAAAAVMRPYRKAMTTPQGLVEAINSANLGVSAQLLNTGDGSANPFQIVVTGATGTENAFTLQADDGLGVAQEQTLSFGPAEAAGNIVVAGVTVAVEPGDSPTVIASKVTAALQTSEFINGTEGRSVTNNLDGSVAVRFSTADGVMPDIQFRDADNTEVGYAVTTTQAFERGGVIDALSFQAIDGLEAKNAELEVNGLRIYRSSNTIDDAISGATLTLRAPSAVAATVVFERDISSFKDKVSDLVKKYNDMVSDFKILTGEKSDDPEDIYSGSLVGDSTVRTVLSQVRDVLFGSSSTPGGDVKALRDLGVSVDRTGVATFDEKVFDAKVSTNFDDIVLMFSANTNNQSSFGTANRGLAGDLIKKVDDLIGQRGFLQAQTDNAKAQITRNERSLEILEERMESLLQRYTKQFAVMETLVGQMNAMRENLKGQFENLAAMYKNN
jgi:flagellar hook-associated protein 2